MFEQYRLKKQRGEYDDARALTKFEEFGGAMNSRVACAPR